MAKRYCNNCKVHIKLVDDNTKCSICMHETVLETEQAKVKHVRDIFMRLSK